MKRHQNLVLPAILLSITGGILVPTPAAQAGKLIEKWISPEANWLVHIDMDAMRRSAVGSMLLANPEKFDIDFEGLEDFKTETGIDIRKDVFSLTMYGVARDIEENGVVIAVTNAVVDETIALIERREDILAATIERDGYLLHQFSGDGDDLFVHLRMTNRPDRRVMVIGGDPGILVGALRVIDGDAPNITARSRMPNEQETRRTWTQPMKGSIFFATVHDVEDVPELEPVSEVVRLCEAFTVDVGEHEGMCRAMASVYAGNREDAQSIKDVVQGLLALGRLVAGEDPDLAPLEDLVDALSIKADGRRITMRIEFEARELLEAMEANDS